MSLLQRTCARPNCDANATRTYTDESGNGMKVCRECYYNFVSGKSVL